MQIKWVYTRAGVPIVSDFSGTRGLGTPVVIDESTDTPYYLKAGIVTAFAGGGGGGGVWGSITGTLSDQTDLQAALDDKANLAGGNTFTGIQVFDDAVIVDDALVIQSPVGNLQFADQDTSGSLVLYNLNDTLRIYNLTSDVITFSTTGLGTFTGGVSVPASAFGAGWNGSLLAVTQDAVYDKITTGLTAAELAANSGGGSTSFLRADATWAPVGAATFLGTQMFDSGSGTYNATPGTVFVVIEIQGGGGAGGGSVTTAAGGSSPCAGGGGGGYVRVTLTSDFDGGSYSVGTAGTGVAAAVGNNGGDSTFTDTAAVVYTGGGGGGAASSSTGTGASASAAVGGGGTATGGDINIAGSAGYFGARSTGANAFAGNGANSLFGMGGRGRASYSTNTSQVGFAGTGYGAGGGGALSSSGGSAAAGGAGTGGIILIHEYGA